MQRLVGVIFVLFFVAGLGCKSAHADDNFVPPKTKPGDGGWELYEPPYTIDATTAKGLSPGTTSPEAAVVHFYASKIRGDDAYEAVLPKPEARSKKLLAKLDKMQHWTYTKVELIKRMKEGEAGYWIKVYMDITINGKTDSGTDEAEVQLIDGAWIVVSPPT